MNLAPKSEENVKDTNLPLNQRNIIAPLIGSQPFAKGPEDWFAGFVRIDPLIQAKNPARAVSASITFEPWSPDGMTHPSVGSDPDCYD